MECQMKECNKKAVWKVDWWSVGIHGRYLDSYTRILCDGCMEPWLEKIRPAHDIHYIKL
jgi:hypothetical protein